MQEELIKFETAKLAKEKGFDCPCANYIYNPSDLILVNGNRERITGNKNTFKKDHIFSQYNKKTKGRLINRNEYSTTISIPTQSLLQRWLREVHGINLVVDCKWIIGGFECKGYNLKKDNDCLLLVVGYNKYPTYEQALEAGLLKALNLI